MYKGIQLLINSVDTTGKLLLIYVITRQSVSIKKETHGAIKNNIGTYSEYNWIRSNNST